MIPAADHEALSDESGDKRKYEGLIQKNICPGYGFRISSCRDFHISPVHRPNCLKAANHSPEQRADYPALPGPVQVIWANSERAILPLPAQKQKPSPHSVPLNTERYQPKQRQVPSLFSLQMKITPAPKRLLALRRRREGVYTLKGTGQPSSRSKRDLFGTSLAPAGAFRRPTAASGS